MKDLVAGMVAQATEKLAGIPEEKVAALEEKMTFDFEMYLALLNSNAFAVASGKLSQVDAQAIHAYVGEAGPDRLNGQPLAVRITLMHILASLVGAKAN